MLSNGCHCQHCCCNTLKPRVLLTLEELEKLRIERQNGIKYVDRISECGLTPVIHFRMGLDAIR